VPNDDGYYPVAVPGVTKYVWSVIML
jgi:hypothetical protein